jgi:hypothetical protein
VARTGGIPRSPASTDKPLLFLHNTTNAYIFSFGFSHFHFQPVEKGFILLKKLLAVSKTLESKTLSAWNGYKVL